MSLIKGLWDRLAARSVRFAVLTVAFIGIVVGVLGTVTFNAALEYTNTTEFCTSCHTMEWPAEEWRKSDHYMNASGKRIGCSDCHVPNEFFPKMVAKVRASSDVWHQMMGTIDTREKYDARREYLGEKVHDWMRRTDSRTCRACHEWTAMDLEAQSRRGRNQHEQAIESGETCIECHTGVAHEPPEPDFGF